ncbi:hypothetical protein HPC49_31540 [Pyxidicoccus fallax]|uniref:Uncharacterized protein n=1 Tax=Pyxidicoccus fallax TaxID=394095 RepID=A0A848LD80_9BACT|nr:hypothetical protein [Pyxidicoccus fallax]NMO16959.1 hypothetical protein [Pyxidicoccus fallax]NPC82743.1 hypothetical protein [Pyxidicoccus fallax]
MRSTSRSLFVLCLLLSTSVMARAPAPDDDISPTLRITSETVGAVLAGSSGVALGFLGGIILSDGMTCGFDDCRTGQRLTAGTSALGLGLGAATGVYLAGSLMDGHGRLLPTFLGGLVGAGAPLAVIGLTGTKLEGAPLIVGLALPIVGSILGYELSDPGPAARQARRDGPLLLPTVGLAPGGGAFGLAGRF